MYALHALWRADDRLALWAEDAAAFHDRPERGATGAGGHGATAHPYACSAADVARLLAGIGPALGWLADQGAERWTGLRLPTLGARPTPSPDLPIGATARGRTLAPWRVPGLLFEPAEAAQLLGALHDPHWPGATAELPDGTSTEIAYGASLRWLTAVHDLAWRLVGRGRLLPALERDGDTWYARWHPALDGPARTEAAALAAGCPPVCRAEYGPAEPTGARLLDRVLTTLVDREARTALAAPADLDAPARPTEPAGTSASPPPSSTARRAAASSGADWSAALSGADGRLAEPPPEGVAERLAGWRASRPEPGPVRLDFRLSEPLGAADDDPEGRAPAEVWRLDLLVRAADRPSLVVPAAELWTGGPGRDALAHSVTGPPTDPADRTDPTEAFLAELDRATRLRPELRVALHRTRPSGLDLDRAGALAFLREAAPALAAAGFGVLLPAWWQRRPRLGLALTARTVPAPGAVKRTAQVDRDAVLAFDWQVSLGELTLTRQELDDLAGAQQGLVRLRGRWVEVDAEQIAAAVRFLARRGSADLGPADLLRLALDDSVSVDGFPVTAVHADGPLGDLLAGRTGTAPDRPEPPRDFTGTLRPYQQRGLAWLDALGRLGLGAVLADDMGLGKTVQTLALLALEKSRGASGPVLLVCPMSLVGNWQREAERFAPGLRVQVHHGADRTAPNPAADLVITTYGLVQRDVAQLRRIRWRRIVADEAQHIKNHGARQSRAVRSLRSGPRIALTGTPVENRLAELHAVLDFANPGLFGSPESFKERFAVPIEQSGNTEVAARLRRLTAPFVLRRAKTDPAVIDDLPAKQEFTVRCNLTAEQAGLYQAVVADLLQRLGGIRGVERRGAVLAAIGRLKQVCNHPAQLLHDGSPLGQRSGKVERLEALLREALDEGDRTLVFTQYAEFGELLHPYLRGRLGEEVLYLHGGVPKARRDELVARFQAADGPRVFLLSLKAGGTGLNLSAANQVIHLDRWWNPAVEDQATDRAHRIGQRREVQVRRLVCVGTVEERIAELLDAKRAVADAVIAPGEQWLTELPTERLRELLTLSADAMGE
ncbi:DEAD/DEAH box helicase [Kitasatospora cinereorecta]|uniref:DEAD/DEAH box helicase n=1 Tax=Kitasatospora cinereorecta TaxID=285560 RepID=A0ABW0VAJ2_9ACTN